MITSQSRSGLPASQPSPEQQSPKVASSADCGTPASRLLAEGLISLTEAARHCPRHREGRKVHRSTVSRWATRGVRGCVLETLRTPSGLCTTKQALARFFQEITNTTQATPAAPRVSRFPDDRRHAEVERELRARFGV